MELPDFGPKAELLDVEGVPVLAQPRLPWRAVPWPGTRPRPRVFPSASKLCATAHPVSPVRLPRAGRFVPRLVVNRLLLACSSLIWLHPPPGQPSFHLASQPACL